MFVNRSFFGFLAGLVAGMCLVLAVENWAVGQFPQMLKPVDLRLIGLWRQDFQALPIWLFFTQLLSWGLGMVFAAYLSTSIARGIAIVGLGSGLAIWVYSLGQVFTLPYPWWIRVLVLLSVLVGPLLGMMIGRYPYRQEPNKVSAQS